jgi:ORF6N domain
MSIIFDDLNGITIRGQEVFPDRVMADFYEVKLSTLRYAVSKNMVCFARQGLVQLPKEEIETHNVKYVFTAFGAAMLATVLKSSKAERLHVQMVRDVCGYLNRDENIGDYAQTFMPLWEAEFSRF